MKRGLGVLVLLALVCLLSAAVSARDEKVIEKTFDRVESLRINTIIGDCVIKKGSGDKIQIRVEYTYDEENFSVDFKERGGTLYVEEDIEGENTRGESQWIITVPEGIDIRFKSATGGLEAEGLTGEMEFSSGTGGITVTGFKGDLEASSGTGKISVSGSEGEFELSSGTGNVTVKSSSGIFEAGSGTGTVTIDGVEGDIEANSGTGHVRAVDVTLEEFGEFSSGTGNAEVSLPRGKGYELSVTSGTGNAELDCGGNDLDARVEMTAKARHGSITSSYDFDEEEKFYRDDDEYVRKSFTNGSGDRKIEISTGTGKAKLKK